MANLFGSIWICDDGSHWTFIRAILTGKTEHAVKDIMQQHGFCVSRWKNDGDIIPVLVTPVTRSEAEAMGDEVERLLAESGAVTKVEVCWKISEPETRESMSDMPYTDLMAHFSTARKMSQEEGCSAYVREHYPTRMEKYKEEMEERRWLFKEGSVERRELDEFLCSIKDFDPWEYFRKHLDH